MAEAKEEKFPKYCLFLLIPTGFQTIFCSVLLVKMEQLCLQEQGEEDLFYAP